MSRVRPSPSAAALVAAVLLAVLVFGACALGPGGERRAGVELRVTRDFGQKLLRAAQAERVGRDATVMRLLQAEARVETGYGGGFVQSIDGLAGRGGGGSDDWFYFVNGLEGDRGAADRTLEPGDIVQWDYRRWSGAMSIPAIVGAFPEPLVSGTRGRRLPVRLECADERARGCSEATRRLAAAEVTASRAALGDPAGETVVRVLVGPWSALRRGSAGAKLERGPQVSGVFARFDGNGRRLELLDAEGRPARAAPPGSGLVAATVIEGGQRVWLVTGLDDAGVERAAAALDRATLRDRYAVAALPEGVLALPVVRGKEGAR